MQAKREQVFVGLFVLVAVAVLFATVFTMSGAAGKSTTKFHAYFPFAGGLEPGATVRYAGGPKVGRVDSIKLDPWPITARPENIPIVVCGGGHSTHAFWMQADNHAVLGREIKVPEAFDLLLAEGDRNRAADSVPA